MEPLTNLISRLWREKKQMPIISKVSTPTPNGAQTAYPPPDNDPLAEALPVSMVSNTFVNVTIYGPNRVGKTTLGCQFEKPLLLASFEPGEGGGSNSVRNEPGVQFLRLASRDQAIAVVGRLRQDMRSCWHLRGGKWEPNIGAGGRPVNDGAPFKSVLVDSVTTAQDVILAGILGLDRPAVQLKFGRVSKEQYQERAEKTKELMQLFRDLRCNTVFLALEKDHNPQEEWGRRSVQRLDARPGAFYGPDCGDSPAKYLYNASDWIFQLYLAKEVKVLPGQPIEIGGVMVPGDPQEVETGRIVRRLRCRYAPNFMAGCRSPNADNVPDWIEAPSPQEFYLDVMRLVCGDKTKYGKRAQQDDN